VHATLHPIKPIDPGGPTENSEPSCRVTITSISKTTILIRVIVPTITAGMISFGRGKWQQASAAPALAQQISRVPQAGFETA